MSLFSDATGLPDPLDRQLGAWRRSAEKLEFIAGRVRRCRRCGLSEHRRHAVPGEGNDKAKIMFVGEAPGQMEDAAGAPFVGRSGEILDQLLANAAIGRSGVFITSVVKCRPVKADDEKLRNRAPRTPEIRACQPYLVRQVDTIRPRVIVCLGAIGARTVIGPRFDITRERGIWFEGPFGARVLATFHPAYVLRNGGAGVRASELRRVVVGDLKRALAESERT